MSRLFIFSCIAALFGYTCVSADELVFDHGFEDPKLASAATSFALPMSQDETAQQRGSEVTDNGINTATVGFNNKFALLLKDEDGRVINFDNPQDQISCALISVGSNTDFVSDEVACSGTWQALGGNSGSQLVLSYSPIRSSDLPNNIEWQLQVTINGEILVAAARTVVYAGLLDYSQSTVEILGGVTAGVATAGHWIEVLLTGFDVFGNRRVFANDGDKKFTAITTNSGAPGNDVVSSASQIQSAFESDVDIPYQGQGQYKLRFYPYFKTTSLQIAYNTGGVTHDFVVRAGDPAPTSRLRSDGQVSAQIAICGHATGCVAGQDFYFTLDSRDAFGAGHNPNADLACAIFSPGCSGTGVGNIRGAAEGDGGDYLVSMRLPGERPDGDISFLGGVDPNFFTYSFNRTIAATAYSLAVTTATGDRIRGGCSGGDCKSSADNSTTVSAFAPLEIVAGSTYPPYLRESYSPGVSLQTACIPGNSWTLTLRPTDFWRNVQATPDPARFSATVTESGAATDYTSAGGAVVSNGEVIEITYLCPNVAVDVPYTIDITYAGNVEYPGEYTFQLRGTTLEAQNVYALLSPIQEPDPSPISGNPALGPTMAWDMETLTAGELATWTLREYTDSSYSTPGGSFQYFSVTLEDQANPGTFLWPAPLVYETGGVPGQYDVSFTPKRAGVYTVRIYRNSILQADVTSAGAGFSAEILPGSVSGAKSFVTRLPAPATISVGEAGFFLVDLRDELGNVLAGAGYEVSATYSGNRTGEVNDVHIGQIDTADCTPSGLSFLCAYTIDVAADFTFIVSARALGGTQVLVGKSAAEGYPLTVFAGPASPSNSTVFGPIPDFVAGTANSLNLIARDSFGNRAIFSPLNQGIDAFVLSLELNPDISPIASLVGNAVSQWTFTVLVNKTSTTNPACPATPSCANELSISLNGNPIQGSPFDLNVIPGPQDSSP